MIYLCSPVCGMDPNDACVEISTRPCIIDGDGHSFIRIANLTLTHCANFVQFSMLCMGATTGEYKGTTQGHKPADRRRLQGPAGLGTDRQRCLLGQRHRHRPQRPRPRGKEQPGASSRANGVGRAELLSNVLLEGNEGSWCNIKNYPHLWEGGGLKFAVCDHVHITKHKAFHNKGPGIWYDIEVYDSTVEDSVAAFNYHCGIMVEISERLKVTGNLVYRNRQDTWCGSGILVQLCSHSEIAGNVCVNNEQFGVYMRWQYVDSKAEDPSVFPVALDSRQGSKQVERASNIAQALPGRQQERPDSCGASASENRITQAVSYAGFGYSNALLAALNIASGGLFWWQQPTHLSRFYDSLIDLENNVKAEIGRSPELKIGWPRAVLDSETLDRVVVAFVAIPKPDDRAKHEPFNHYLTGVGYLAKTDVFLQFEFQAYGAFLASLTAALRIYRPDLGPDFAVAYPS